MNQSCVIRQCPLTDDESGRYACYRCTEGIRRHIREIEAYAHLASLMPTLLALPGRADFGRRSPGYGSTPPPGLLETLDALDPRRDAAGDDHSVLWRLDSICRVVLEERTGAGVSEPHESYHPTLAGAITYLLWTAEWCAYQPWVDDHASGVAAIHAQIRARGHDRPPAPLAPCLLVGCGGKVFWSRDITDPSDPDGARTLDCARCAACGRPYYGTDLYRLRAQEAS